MIIKTRSPYLYIKPETSANSAIYNLQSLTQSRVFSYTDSASGNTASIRVATMSTTQSFCAVIGSMTGGSFSVSSLCGGTYSSPVNFDTTTYLIKSWNNDLVTNKPSTILYSKQKQKVVTTQTHTYVNLSNLLNEGLEGDVKNYVNISDIRNTGLNESRWASVEGDFYKNGLPLGRTFSNTFYVVDGYDEFDQNKTGLPQVLINGEKRQYTKDAMARLHFKTLSWSRIYSFTGTGDKRNSQLNPILYTLPVNIYPDILTSAIYPANPNKNNEYIKSIKVDTDYNKTYLFCYNTNLPGTSQYYIPDYVNIPVWNTVDPSGGPLSAGFEVIWGGKIWANTGGQTGENGGLGYAIDEFTLGGIVEDSNQPVWIEAPYPYSGYSLFYGSLVNTFIQPNCKYENYDVIFKNKFGVLETLSFSKKSSKAINIEDSEYLRSIVDYNGAFDITRHTRKTYNTSAYVELTLNTDFLPEYMNNVFADIMTSEELWLVDSKLKIIPINKSDTNLTFKTHIDDKLIQYTMKVKISHNIINNIL